jgi:hypothetical protein
VLILNDLKVVVSPFKLFFISLTLYLILLYTILNNLSNSIAARISSFSFRFTRISMYYKVSLGLI